MGGRHLHYRFGKPGHIGLDIVNAPDWSNVHRGGVRGLGGGEEDWIRFTKGQTHYIVFSGALGSLSPHSYDGVSGIAIVQGVRGQRRLGRMDCRARPPAGELDSYRSELRDTPFDVGDSPFTKWY